MKKIILTVISMSVLFFIYKLFLNHSFKDLPASPHSHLDKQNVTKEKRQVEATRGYESNVAPVANEKLALVNDELKAHQPQSVTEKLQDPEYTELLENGEFQAAMKHILKKSEEHISGNPSREDYAEKLEVMHRYVKHDPDILKRDFNFFVGYYTLSAFEKKDEEIRTMDDLIENFYSKKIAESTFCMQFFKEVSKAKVDYSNLSSVVFNCAANPRKRSIVHDYVNFLKQNKNENYAMEEYMKLRLLYNDLPEYGTYHQNL